MGIFGLGRMTPAVRTELKPVHQAIDESEKSGGKVIDKALSILKARIKENERELKKSKQPLSELAWRVAHPERREFVQERKAALKKLNKLFKGDIKRLREVKRKMRSAAKSHDLDYFQGVVKVLKFEIHQELALSHYVQGKNITVLLKSLHGLETNLHKVNETFQKAKAGVFDQVVEKISAHFMYNQKLKDWSKKIKAPVEDSHEILAEQAERLEKAEPQFKKLEKAWEALEGKMKGLKRLPSDQQIQIKTEAINAFQEVIDEVGDHKQWLKETEDLELTAAVKMVRAQMTPAGVKKIAAKQQKNWKKRATFAKTNSKTAQQNAADAKQQVALVNREIGKLEKEQANFEVYNIFKEQQVDENTPFSDLVSWSNRVLQQMPARERQLEDSLVKAKLITRKDMKEFKNAAAKEMAVIFGKAVPTKKKATKKQPLVGRTARLKAAAKHVMAERKKKAKVAKVKKVEKKIVTAKKKAEKKIVTAKKREEKKKVTAKKKAEKRSKAAELKRKKSEKRAVAALRKRLAARRRHITSDKKKVSKKKVKVGKISKMRGKKLAGKLGNVFGRRTPKKVAESRAGKVVVPPLAKKEKKEIPAAPPPPAPPIGTVLGVSKKKSTSKKVAKKKKSVTKPKKQEKRVVSEKQRLLRDEVKRREQQEAAEESDWED